MLGIKNATRAAEGAAAAVEDLAETAKAELSETLSQVKTGTQLALPLLIGVGVVATVALILSIVAVTRRD